MCALDVCLIVISMVEGNISYCSEGGAKMVKPPLPSLKPRYKPPPLSLKIHVPKNKTKNKKSVPKMQYLDVFPNL